MSDQPSPALSHDPLWPRTGGWPRPDGAEADAALIGLPTRRTSLSPTHADATPSAVRDALRRYSALAHVEGRGAVDLDEALRIVDAGDIAEPDHGRDEDAAVAAVRALAERARLVVALGGDNAATVPAALGAWGDGIASAGLITFDAHHDLRDGISNGSPVRRLIEAGLDGRRVVQIGIADFANSLAYARRAQKLGITVIPRDALHDRPIADVVDEALAIAGAGGGAVHVDVDVDVCDRAVAPACPASVPGGLSASELRRAVRRVTRDPRVRSLDLTEVDATADTPDGRTVRLVATLVLEALAGVAGR
ncbi:arginase family protein [Microbacterium sp. JZ70]